MNKSALEVDDELMIFLLSAHKACVVPSKDEHIEAFSHLVFSQRS